MCNDNKNSSLSNSIVKGILAGAAPDKEIRISDLPESFTSLKERGATEEDALVIIYTELDLLNEYKENGTSISPQLFDLFGAQHTTSALPYAYGFMQEYDLTWDEYERVLNSLLSIYRPEDLIRDPDLIVYYLIRLAIADRDSFENVEDLENHILSNMKKRDDYPVTDENN